MYWTLELASKLEDAPWPATKDELIDYAVRSGAPLEVIEIKIFLKKGIVNAKRDLDFQVFLLPLLES